ncbi:hypothetical protein Afil01_31180 [Actinorhabdospora filicis]|uniref:LysM domain-containing protein n=1 Tax=Actinorhabdospora filicis TaxID=1785913 RepID=A0A9W6SPE7_9ACTN|nr:BTAD domain-containing putative transcriptional regulator [Actinorhabdospora filicis]GLZ78311.1 hypothetical protein Afil01_31180 [Actinorhabdospora filicis]
MRTLAAIARAAFWLAVLIGLPLLLLRYGSPLPAHWPRGEDWRALVEIPDDRRLADLIVILGWLAWATLLYLVVRRVVRASRTQAPPSPRPARWHVPGPVRAISALLLGTATASVTAQALAAPASAGPVLDAPAEASPVRGESGVHLVRAGESLWSIAGERLGDPWRWGEIWDLNRDAAQGDGRRFDDPDLIRPGWTLRLPASTAPVEEIPEPRVPDPVTPAPSETGESHSAPAVAMPEDGGFRLPSGAWIGAGLATAVAAAVVLTRARRRRALALGRPVRIARGRPGTAGIIDAAQEAKTAPPPPAETDLIGLGDLSPGRVIALLGDGAPGAARHLLAEQLTLGEVLTDQTTWTALTGTEPPMAVRGLHVAEDAPTRLQQLILSRTRARDDGQDPVPLLIVLQHPVEADAATLTELAITGIAFESAENTEAFDLDEDGRDHTHRVRFHHLTAADFDAAITALSDATPPTPDDEPPAAPQEALDEEPAPTDDTAPTTPQVLADLRAFGPPAVHIAGVQVPGLRNKSLELLVMLAASRDHGVHKDTIIEAILPDTAMSKAPNHLRTLIANIRSALREASGNREGRFVLTDGDFYRLDTTTLTSDLHRYEEHLLLARTSDDENEQLRHLTAAAGEFSDVYAEGRDAEWTETVREHYRRQHTGTLTRLADLHRERGEHAKAITVLEDACRLAPLDEPLHQRAITVALAAHRSDRALVLFRALKRELGHIGERPQQATYGLFNEPPG